MDLRAYRKSRRLTQGACAEQLGLKSKSYVSGLETGAVKAPIDLALRIQGWSGGQVPARELVPPEKRHLLDALDAAGA
jgi:transcriptional regulator with XRE-family HTH domain